ncbi:unnamed protein product [Onchocerca ochengi]|uniref:BTB domain-containing protein n=1 Tax=Onchocerca ochengi TaxID=42157 RepID=A0A182ED11_ONCOC|nr:unnamed protein product [Onchocerca ochengi]
MITKEIGRSVFSTVHGVRYIEWTLHVKKEQNQVVVELTRQTDTDIKGEFRVQFRAQSKKGKYRVEYVPHYTEKLMELYREEEFSPGQLNIEMRLAFASDDFNYIISKVDLNPLLKLEPESTTDKRLKAMLFVEENVALMYYIQCTDEVLSYNRYYLYITCRYFHDYMNDNPEENSISLDFESTTVEQVLSFAFTGLCQMKYYGGSLDSSDFANYHQFLACFHLLKPLMNQELLQMYDDDFCRIFQKVIKII